MIGEIRDAETAKIAIEASLTGHLVLSTLHTNNASESVVRLLDLGMDPMNFADSLLGLVAQRLVRKLCTRLCHAATAGCRGLAGSGARSTVEGSNLSPQQAEDRLLTPLASTSPEQVHTAPRRGLRALRRQGLQRAHRCVRNSGKQPCHQAADPERERGLRKSLTRR